MHTQDIASVNIERIGQLFPNCLTERLNQNGKPEMAIDFDKLKQELSKEIVEGNQERYQFTWPGKREAMRLANTPSNMTLRPDRESSVDFDNTENLYIEGDNLEVLKLLRENYLGKVKMIYIDPPYNTGNDFVYEDDFSENAEEFKDKSGMFDDSGNMLLDKYSVNSESNGRFHTDWLNMMYPRIKVAKDLLSDDGIIFISLDDNEIDNMKKICNEVLGESNFAGQITVVANPRGRDYGGIARMHDYVLCYRRSPSSEINLIQDENNEFPYSDSIGGFELRELRNRNIKFNRDNRPNLYYPFYINPNSTDKNGLCQISLDPVPDWIELYPLESQGVKTVWRWGKEKSLSNLNINIMAKPMRNGSYMIVEKYRESRLMARSVWWDKDTNTEKGTLLLKELLAGKIFDYPKPVEMLQRICEMGSNPDDIILDFFSGSSTTAHAVMKLNSLDDGKRKFIMIQLPEKTKSDSVAFNAGYKTICEIGKERIRRAGRKIKENAPLTSQSLDTGFRVLKLDTSNMQDVYYKPEEFTEKSLFEDNVKPDRTSEDLLFQVMLECNLTLSAKIERKTIAGKEVFNVNEGYLLACFDGDVNETVITEVAKLKPYYFIMRDKSLSSDNVADNFEQIFNAYSKDTIRRIL